MKSFVWAIVLPGIATALLMLGACSETVAHHEENRRNWDGSVTHQETNVQRNPITGSTTVEQDKYRARD